MPQPTDNRQAFEPQLVREPLTERDLGTLERCFITPQLVEQAGIFRVDSAEGARLIGRSGDYAGIVFPYYWPGEESPREYCLRRDHPDLEQQSDGRIKETAKYLSPPGRGNLLYFTPGTAVELLTDSQTPIIITEGEKKTLALTRLSGHKASSVRFLPIGLSGVWNWRGRVAKTVDERGARRDVKGVIADFDRVVWQGRRVYIIFDANVDSNENVGAARRELAKELKRRGSDVRFVDLPQIAGVNGVDDLLAAEGCHFVLGLIAGAKPLEEKEQRKSQATKIVELAREVELFHTSDDEAYASFEVGQHVETWQLKSRGFRDWLTRQLYEAEGKAPAAQSLQDALNVLSSRARFEGDCREVHLRIAEHDRAIYVDLADSAWRVVQITGGGWQVIDSRTAPVRFRRSKGMLPLPTPLAGSSIAVLRPFVNATDQQWPLILAALVAYLRPNRSFPVLALHGEQGSAKSTTARVLRALIDPNKAALRSEPRDERDLMIAAKNGWLIAFDNLSRIPSSLSDSICRLATGGSFGTRRLYEDDEEVLFDAMRPVLVNGIEELATRSDLLDRTLVLTLPTIPDDRRRTEAQIWEEFELKRPAIFGALLDAVSCALRNHDSLRLETPPRMADFARWAVAAELALGLEEGEFMRAYTNNREAANDLALELSPVSTAVLGFLDGHERWKGTVSELLVELNARAADDLKKQYIWPKTSQALGGILKRLAPNLRAIGIKTERGTGRERRLWILEKLSVSLSPLSPVEAEASGTSE